MNARVQTPTRAVVVAPVITARDAIGQSAVDTVRQLLSMPGMSASLLTCACDRADVPAKVVSGLADLLVTREFLDADLIVYQFGLYNPLFDALLVGNGRARQVVRFHNVTPPDLVRAGDVRLIERSFHQMSNFSHADAIWADSATNARVLVEAGVDDREAEVIPLVVDDPPRYRLSEKGPDRIEILFLGRFVRSKGVLDLLRAFASIIGEDLPPVRVRLVGSQTFSHPEYVEEVKATAAAIGNAVEFVGSVDDATRDDLLRAAHILAIPSYHEGFCRPVVEGLRAGCIPVGYAAHNLPNICAGLGRLVPAGDTDALAAALKMVVKDLAGMSGKPERTYLRLDRGETEIVAFEDLVSKHVQQFEYPAVRQLTEQSVRRLMGSMSHLRKFTKMYETRPFIDVRSDNEMRMAERASLNRLPDLSDWEAGGTLSRIMQDLNTPVTIHRKSWEYALCIHGLDTLGVARPDAVGLAVGAGSESPLYYYANTISRMVATDLYDNETHEGTPLMLREPEKFAPFPYRQDRLEVYRMSGDKLEFDDGTFDFVFCLSSIEHFGSRDTQRRALNEMARVLRPGGVACIITELILTNNTDAEFFSWEEVNDIFLSHPRLRLDGGKIDLSISESLVAFPVDLTDVAWPLSLEKQRYLAKSPHIVLRRHGMLWTSLGLFLRRV
jgi:glycosyltransferase involved in cell wall biosynthesis/SAM-dependent methyltransferase